MRRIGKFLGIIRKVEYLHALLRMGVAAGVEHTPVIQNMHCKTVVDVGANRGQFSLVARTCFPDARIYAFEPLHEPAEKYRRVLFGKDTNVVLRECAIGRGRETKVIHVSNADDSSSLLPIGDMQTHLFPETREKETREVQVYSLDEMLSPGDILPPALLKIDVQGFELDVLHGCESLLPDFSWVYVECSFVELYEGQALADEVINFLHGHGFVLRGVYNLFYDSSGKAIQGDFLFERK